MVVKSVKRMEMDMVIYFKKKGEDRVTFNSEGRCIQVDYILCRRCNLKEVGGCKVVSGRMQLPSIGWQSAGRLWTLRRGSK